MFLLDTNVVSELRRPKPHGAVLAWLNSVNSADLFISAMTVAEVQRGIERTREQDAQKAQVIEGWLEHLLGHYQVIAAGVEVMRQWARLTHRRSDTLQQDALIAATAQVHQLTVVTRNGTDFEIFGVTVLNPFEFKAS